MKPIAWTCLAVAFSVFGTVPTSASACSPSFDHVDEVSFEGDIPDCLRIEPAPQRETLIVEVRETCEGEVELRLPEHDVESESVDTSLEPESTTVELVTSTLLSDHFGETIEVPVEWTINGVTEEATMLVDVVDEEPGGGCDTSCSVTPHAPPSALWFALLGLGFVRGRSGRRLLRSRMTP